MTTALASQYAAWLANVMHHSASHGARELGDVTPLVVSRMMERASEKGEAF